MRSGWGVCAALLLFGCLPDEASDPDFNDSIRDPDSGSGGSQDSATPAEDAAIERDAATDAAPVPDGPCEFPADCPGGDCVDGRCNFETAAACEGTEDPSCPAGESCTRFLNAYSCTKPCEVDQTCRGRARGCQAHFNCPFGQVCHDNRCITACTTDIDCGPRGHCLDGECSPYPQDLFTGDAPEPFGEPGQLYAGVGWVPLDYPVGVSMAGYGARPGPKTPYSVALGGSDRFFEGQDVRVIALSTEEDLVIVIRLPLGWSTDYLLTLTALKLQELTKSPEHPNGINYHSKLVTGATHSHSQPARFWYLLPATGFAVAGYDVFSPELASRYAESFARAAHQALENMRPARFGWKVIEDFDPERRIHSDRRGANEPYLDDRMLVWRVDDADGRPIGGMVNFAMHGTHMLSPWVTGDAPAGVEVVTTEALSAQAGRPVPVMFMNGNAGDVSPRGDNAVEEEHAKMQACGHRTWPIFRDAFDSIETRADWDLEIITRRVPLSYRHIGYEDGQFATLNRFSRPHFWGGFQCATAEKDWDAEPYEDGALNCRLNMETYLHHPVPQFGKATLTVFRIGDLVMTTLPGEPSSRLGRDLGAAVEERAAAAGQQVTSVNFGYSQDHHLYLLPQNDWLHGGYETGMSLWGYRNGDYLAANSVTMAEELFTPEKEPADERIKPSWWPDLTEPHVVVVSETPGGVSGTFDVDPPTEVRRGDLIDVKWTGGHPGVDLPRAHLEVRAGDAFEPAMKPSGLAYDNWGFDTLTIYDGDYEADHGWSLRWELGFDLPLGEYRVVVEGQEADAGGDGHAYTVTSAPFTVRPTTLQLREITAEGGMIGIDVNYPEGPSNDDGRSAFELEPTGHWLRHDADRDLNGPARQYALMLGAPVTGNVRVAVGDDVAEVTPAADTVAFDLVVGRDDGGTARTARVEGWSSGRVSVPAAAGRHAITVTDAWGNSATVMVDVP